MKLPIRKPNGNIRNNSELGRGALQQFLHQGRCGGRGDQERAGGKSAFAAEHGKAQMTEQLA